MKDRNPLAVYPGRWKKADREAVQKIYKDETASLEDREEAAKSLAFDFRCTITRKLRSIGDIKLLDSLIDHMKEDGKTDKITAAELIGYMDADEVGLLWSEVQQAKKGLEYLEEKLKERHKAGSSRVILDFDEERRRLDK